MELKQRFLIAIPTDEFKMLYRQVNSLWVLESSERCSSCNIAIRLSTLDDSALLDNVELASPEPLHR